MKVFQSMTLTAATVALLGFSIPVPALAVMKDMHGMKHLQGHGHMMEMGNMDRMDEMMGMCIEHADKMGLTDEQLAKVKPLHREMQKKQARFKADLKIAEIELMEIMEVKDFDLEKAKAAVYKSDELKTAYHLEMLKTMKEMRTLLTEDQFKKMKKDMPWKHNGNRPVKKQSKK